MQRDRIYLQDILESILLVEEYLKNVSEGDFTENIQCQDSVIRRLEIIGEAARRISEEGRRQWPGLPWREMITMRNFVIHEDDGVDPAIVWTTATKETFPKSKTK